MTVTSVSLSLQGDAGRTHALADAVRSWNGLWGPASEAAAGVGSFFTSGAGERFRKAKYSELAFERAVEALGDGDALELQYWPGKELGEVSIIAEIVERGGVDPVATLHVGATYLAGQVGQWQELVRWGHAAAVATRATAGCVDTPSGLLNRGLLEGFPDVYWGTWLGGALVQRLDGAGTVLQEWPGSTAEDLSTDDHPLVFLQLSPELGVAGHRAYEQAFVFLGPVLRTGAAKRLDPGLFTTLQSLLHADVPRAAWPDEVKDAFPHAGLEPTEEELALGASRPGITNEAYRAAPMPDVDPELVATFKWEEDLEDGERLGPLIVAHPERGVVWESADWMRESDARKLANAHTWRYSVDA